MIFQMSVLKIHWAVEFIATGTTPNNWTSNNSLLITPLPPTAHVIKNTIGDIVLRRDDPGIYEAYLPGAFPKYRNSYNAWIR
jgi:hypothetical protein